jgi:sugar phosphate isomerase/epimerase
MVFGYSTNAFVKFPLDASIEKIADLGFKGVEIMGDRPHLYPPDYEAEDLARIGKLLAEKGLKVTNINSFTLYAVGDTYLPSWIEPETGRREIRIRHTLDCLEIAARLGCKNISVPPGGPLPAISRKEALQFFHQGIERVIPRAESLGIRILVEPEPDLLIENSGQIASFVKETGSPFVGINFDVGHFFCVGEDPSTAFERLFEWVGHIHIEDIGADRAHRHLIPGLGALPFPSILKTIAELGYTGDISLELYPYVDMPEKAGRESLEHLLPILSEAGFKI